MTRKKSEFVLRGKGLPKGNRWRGQASKDPGECPEIAQENILEDTGEI